jgi:hypothetical protein
VIVPGVGRRRLTAGVAAVLCLVGTAVSAAPGAGHPVPPTTFATYSIPSSMPGADFAGEPSVGVDWQTGKIMYQAGPATFRLTPSNGEWTDVSSPDTQFNIDPILATDPMSGLTLAGGDDGSCSVLAVTHNDGDTWQPSLPCTATPDHPTVGIGPVVGSSPQAGHRVVYFCQQYPAVDECTTSTDDGLTWLPAVPVTGGCMGVTGHVKASWDGTAYVPIRSCFDLSDPSAYVNVGAAISTNNGRSWKSYRIPNAIVPSHGFDPSIATTPDNTVYESWGRFDDDKPVVAWSHNHGRTWSAPVNIAKHAPYPIYATAFHAAVAGDNRRVAVAYLGADRPGTKSVTPFDNSYLGAWYLYISASYDGGRHWTTTRVQKAPVQLGPICDNGTQCLSGRNLLDFIDAGVTADGRVVVGYDNGCSGGCPVDPSQAAQSVYSWGAVAIQTTGRSLFRRFGPFSV